MIKLLKNKMKKFLNYYNYYHIEDLQIRGWCGLCGNTIDGVFPENWPWGICNNCLSMSAKDF